MIPEQWVKEYVLYSQRRRLAKCLIVLIFGGWSIYQNWDEKIYFTLQTTIYVCSIFWSQVRPSECVLKLYGELASMTLITTQLCILTGFPKEIAYCNFSTMLIYFLSGFYTKSPFRVMEVLAAVQLFEMMICAYLLRSMATVCLTCLYYYLRYLNYLNLVDYDIAVALCLYTMGMISGYSEKS
ncbi:uncharacterized protein isoform X2 [Rhodnius prolixus]|uniref:Uncharacterized protein n=2 Tax=Rhodnius prolixus TaxID=13249 RepID=T1HKR2_RHOPR